MDIEKLTKDVILKNMSPEQQKAVLDSVMTSVQESKKARTQKVAENVDLVMQALKKIEAKMLDRVSQAADKVETVASKVEKVASNIKNGKDGKDGNDGKDGKSIKGDKGDRGTDGKDGKDGRDGIDGVSVVDAYLDFDNSLVIELSNGKQINVGAVLSDQTAEKVQIVANGGAAQPLLDAIAALQTEIANLIPDQTGNAGKFLTTDGTNLSWAGGGGGLVYQGTWNASTNTPTLASSTGVNGYYYVVGTSGSTNLDGITDWVVGDWVIFNGTTWQKIDNTDLVTSVNGETGDINVKATYYWVKASSAITKGQVCMFTGAVGSSGVITAAPSTGVTNGQAIMGVAPADIALNAFGLVQATGIIRNVSTSGFTDGDIVYYDSAVTGGFTKTFPTSGPIVTVAAVVNGGSSGGGVIQVRVSVTQRITAGSGITITQNDSGTTVTNTSPSTGGTVTSVGAAGTVSGLTLTGGPITSSGTITLGGSLDLSSPPTIGGATPAAGTFTTLTANSTSQFGKGSANYWQATGGATTKTVEFKALGSDTNISQVFQPKGTGAIDLAAGSSGVNISNGGTVTAITRTAGGSGYATAPTVTISPPTTAGGVQATATCTITGGVVDSTFTITNAGSGYVEQPTVSFSGGGGSGAAAYATVGSGTVVRSLNGTMSFYTPAGESLRIDNPSYPTLTDYVSLAGGASVSGAYVSVGGATTNASLYVSAKGTGSVAFFTNGQGSLRQLNVAHTASAVNYVQVTGAATGAGVTVSAQGSDTNIALNFASKAAQNINFRTGASSLAQFTVVHNGATIVNQATATGSATGVAPVFGVQGSDTNIDLTLTPKGTGKVTTSADVNAANFVASSGVYAKTTMSATYTDGIVLDYLTGNGRISVGSADTLTFYTGGVANTQLAQLDTKGNLQISGGIYVNSQTISANYTIPAGSSGHSAGPITVSSGFSVTISSGSKWVVL